MDGFLQPLSAPLERYAEARNLLAETGKPPDVYRQPSQCILEEVIFYGVPAHSHTPGHPHHEGDDEPSCQFDRITAWRFRFRQGAQITHSNGHMVPAFEVPTESFVLARLR